MEFKKRINIIRRTFMRTLTANVGLKNNSSENIFQDTNIRRILISRPNQRLGNLLLITPLLQEIAAVYPQCKIDLFVKGGVAPQIFRNYDTIDTIIELPKKPFKEPFRYLKSWLKIRTTSYDLAINVDKVSSSGRLSVRFSRARFKLFGDSLNESIGLMYFDFKHIAKAPVYNFRFAGLQENIFDKSDKVPYLDLKLDHSEILNGRKILQSLVPENTKVISLFTYATGSKCHSVEWWEEFYEKVRLHFLDYTIIEILPVENISQIGSKALTYYSRDIREIGSVIANTSVFIGADSGIMHLASASKIPVIGLFNVTNPLKYSPYNHNSLGIETADNDIENIIEVLETILRYRLRT